MIVDDDMLIGHSIAQVPAKEHDIAVTGPLSTDQEAINELSRMAMPFIVMSGRIYQPLPAVLPAAPRLTRPFRPDELLALIKRVAGANQ